MQSSQPRTEAGSARKRFRVILVKPSHYDDDGYVIRWLRSPMPSNSLATVYGLVDDCAQRQVLGPDVDIDIVAIDETNTRVRVDRIIARDARRAVISVSSAWSACSRTSIRARCDIAQTVARRRHPGGHRRLSRLRHAGDVPET